MKKNQKKGKSFLCLLLAFMCVFSSSFAFANAENLVKNGTFSDKLKSWSKSKWVSDEDTKFSVNVTEGFAHLQSKEPNHVMIQQKLNVIPKKTYRFRVWAKATIDSSTPDGTASIGVDMTDAVAIVNPDDSDWQLLEFYGKVPSRKRSIKLDLSLGAYGNLASGEVYFKDVEVVRVSEVPEGATVVSLEQTMSNSGTSTDETPHIMIYGELLRMILFAVIAAAIVYGIYYWMTKGGWQLSNQTTEVYLILILCVGFLLRFFLTIKGEGYIQDTNTFAYWLNRVVDVGPSKFYDPEIFCDYPPGLMYFFWIFGNIGRATGIQDFSSGMGLFYMLLPVIIADMAVVILGYCYVLKKRKNPLKPDKGNNIIALGVALILCFLPTILYDGVIWHQVDAVLTCLLVVVFMLIESKHYIISAAVFGIALAIKPQALMVGPVFALAYIFWIIDAFKEQPKKGFLRIAQTIASALLAVAVVYIISLPFKGNQEPMWIFEKYYKTGTSYPYATINAYNFFSLIGANWVPQTEALLGISYQLMGTIFIAITCVLTVILAYKAYCNKTTNWYLLAAFFLFATFCFGPRMHERYGFPVVILLMFAWISSKNKGVIKSFIFVATTQLLNIVIVLFQNKTTLPDTWVVTGIIMLISLAQVLACVYLFIVCWRIASGSTIGQESDEAVLLPTMKQESVGFPYTGTVTYEEIIITPRTDVVGGGNHVHK